MTERRGTWINVTVAPMQVENASCRREAVAVSGSGALPAGSRKQGPDPVAGVERVQIVEFTCRRQKQQGWVWLGEGQFVTSEAEGRRRRRWGTSVAGSARADVSRVESAGNRGREKRFVFKTARERRLR
jgi:hypothetical protein